MCEGITSISDCGSNPKRRADTHVRESLVNENQYTVVETGSKDLIYASARLFFFFAREGTS